MVRSKNDLESMAPSSVETVVEEPITLAKYLEAWPEPTPSPAKEEAPPRTGRTVWWASGSFFRDYYEESKKKEKLNI